MLQNWHFKLKKSPGNLLKIVFIWIRRSMFLSESSSIFLGEEWLSVEISELCIILHGCLLKRCNKKFQVRTYIQTRSSSSMKSISDFKYAN